VTDAIESIVRFGPGENLLGIVTPAAQTVPGAPVCLLFNAGVVHRIGPHRLNVKLARALAARGFTAFRMDLSGLGDSPVSADAASVNSSDQAVADLRAAMDHLERTEGIRSFVLFGLCSGARHGYRLAQVDSRVAGLLMYDGYVYPTFKTHVYRRLKRFRALPWSAVLRKPIDWIARREPAHQVSAVESDEPVQPSPEEFRATMDALVARGTAVYTLHSGSFVRYFNYAGQWRDKFRGAPFLQHSRHDYLPELDHTLSTVAAQRKLIATVGDWVQGLFGSPAGSTASST
jgi:pimeloyl-ACP methyl ester carboxylesterase